MPIYDDALENYVRSTFAAEDEVLATIRSEISRRGLPAISVRPEEGRFLQFLVAASGARLAVEVGTLGGYSGVCIARGLPDGGTLITLEMSEEHAAVARDHFKLADVEDKIDLQIGNAHDLLEKLSPEGPFDFVFIDADKLGLPVYLDWAENNLRPRGLVAAHNAFRHGAIADPSNDDPGVLASKEFNDRLVESGRFVPAIFPGGDGIALGVLKKGA